MAKKGELKISGGVWILDEVMGDVALGYLNVESFFLSLKGHLILKSVGFGSYHQYSHYLDQVSCMYPSVLLFVPSHCLIIIIFKLYTCEII